MTCFISIDGIYPPKPSIPVEETPVRLSWSYETPEGQMWTFGRSFFCADVERIFEELGKHSLAGALDREVRHLAATPSDRRPPLETLRIVGKETNFLPQDHLLQGKHAVKQCSFQEYKELFTRIFCPRSIPTPTPSRTPNPSPSPIPSPDPKG